mgnify:CR=1 FL=1
MISFILSSSHFQLLKRIDLSELGSAISLDESTNTVQTENLRLLQIILTEEITTKGLTPDQQNITQYGKDFVSYARDVVSAIARASAFASSDSELSGTVRVGTLNSLLTASFSDIVPLFHERFPHVQINLHAGNIASITEMLVKNELDIIYTLDAQIFDTQFVKVFEEQEDVVVVTNAENPLAERSDVHLADLVSHPFILMNHGNPYRDQFDRELARQDLSVEPFLELESDTLALRLIRENPEYLSILPLYTAEMSIHKDNLAIIPVADCQMRQWRQVLYHRNKVITPQIQGMLDVILDVAKKPF